MRQRLTSLYRKVHYGAIIPWDCIILGHRYRLHPSGSPYSDLTWWYCDRPGCTHERGLPIK